MDKPTVTQPDGELVPRLWERTRVCVAAGIASRKFGQWVPQHWLEIFMDAYEEAEPAPQSAPALAAEITSLRQERDCFAEQLASREQSSLERDMQEIMQTNNELNAEITHLRAVVSEFMGLLQECADDLEVEIEARYGSGIKDHPAMKPKYERDMEPVNRARTALTRATEAGVQS